MTLTELTKLEETHYMTETAYPTTDGLGETIIEVCALCDEDPNRPYAATFPCEVLEEAEHNVK